MSLPKDIILNETYMHKIMEITLTAKAWLAHSCHQSSSVSYLRHRSQVTDVRSAQLQSGERMLVLTCLSLNVVVLPPSEASSVMLVFYFLLLNSTLTCLRVRVWVLFS